MKRHIRTRDPPTHNQLLPSWLLSRQVLGPLDRQVLCMWGWDELSEWKAKKQSEDPADMELFMLTVVGQGAFAFEFDDAFLIAEAFSEHQKVSEQVADNGGDGVDEQPVQTVEAPVTEAAESAGWTDGGTFRL